MNCFFNDGLDAKVSKLIHKSFYDNYKRVRDIADADIVICGAKPFINIYPKVKYIVCNMTNTDHIIPKQAKVVSLKGHIDFLNTIYSTAEHTLMLMLMLLRKRSLDCYKQLGRPSYPIHDLSSKTVGIIGYGRIGKQLHAILKPLGVKVLTADIKDRDYEKKFNHLLMHSDIISLHISTSKNDNKYLLSKREFIMMKKGVYIVNTARGWIVDDEVLQGNINKIGGYASDFLPTKFVETFLNNEKMIITPHCGGFTWEALKKTSEYCFKLLKKEING